MKLISTYQNFGLMEGWPRNYLYSGPKYYLYFFNFEHNKERYECYAMNLFKSNNNLNNYIYSVYKELPIVKHSKMYYICG